MQKNSSLRTRHSTCVEVYPITITQFDNGIACLIFIKRSHLTLKFKIYLVCGNLSLNKQLTKKQFHIVGRQVGL